MERTHHGINDADDAQRAHRERLRLINLPFPLVHVWSASAKSWAGTIVGDTLAGGGVQSTRREGNRYAGQHSGDGVYWDELSVR